MKYIKQYESINNIPQVGDYILFEDSDLKKEISNFMSNNIGLIVSKELVLYDYVVKYENVPDELTPYFSYAYLKYGRNCRGIERSDIIYFSSNKEDLEIRLQANKYNL